jgi:diguanylate cyclase (GGDEF)-like protein
MKPDQILASLSQLDHHKRPVTLVAIVFFSLVCLSLGGMQGWSVYKARTVQLQAATLASANSTQALGDHVAHGLDLVDTILTDLVERVQLQAELSDTESLARYLAGRSRRTGLLQELAVYDEQGMLADGSSQQAAAGQTVRQHIAHHNASVGDALFIGAPTRSPSGGAWVLPLSRRVLKRDGSFGGIAMGTVRIEQLRDFAARLKLGQDGVMLLALESGPMVMARPQNEAEIGKDMRKRPAFKLWLEHEGMPGEAIQAPPPGVAGGDVLYSYGRVATYPMMVALARPTDEVLASWWDSAYLSTAGVSVLMLIQLWLAVRLYGQIALRDRLEKDRRSLQKLLVKKSRSLRRQALKDALTGIANRRQFDVRLNWEFNRAIEEGASLALVILDVDYFKKYNDRYGHPAGDECLKLVAACVNGGRRRSDDMAARMGGEEFAILLPNTGLRGAIAVAEAIRKGVAAQRMTHVPGSSHSVTVSCGVHAVIPVEGMTTAELVDAADRALYLAKTSGRNRVRAEGTMPPSAKLLSLVVNE